MPATNAQKSIILLVSLEDEPVFDDIYADIINKISNVVSIKRARKARPAVREISNRPHGILMIDLGVARRNNAHIYDTIMVRDWASNMSNASSS